MEANKFRVSQRVFATDLFGSFSGSIGLEFIADFSSEKELIDIFIKHKFKTGKKTSATATAGNVFKKLNGPETAIEFMDFSGRTFRIDKKQNQQ